VVLGDEDEVEADLFGELDLFDPLLEESFPVAGAWVGPFEEETELNAGILQGEVRASRLGV
jgi:hypothetical protein